MYTNICMYTSYSHQQPAASSQQAAVVSSQQPVSSTSIMICVLRPISGSEWSAVPGPWSGVTAQPRGPRSVVRGHSPAALA